MRIDEALKMERFPSEQVKANLNIIYTGNWLSDKIGQFMKQFEISEQQFNVLRILKGQKGKPINLFEIQDRMLHRMSNATRLVEKLRQKGYVERVPCEYNRRMVEITLTDQGLKFLERVNAKLDKSRDIEPMAKLSKKEFELLNQLLDKLRS